MGLTYTIDQVNSFRVPEIKNILAYFDAVRKSTLDYVKGLKPADFEKKITMPRFGEMTIGAVLNIVVSHTAQHMGELSYIRGIERGMDK